MRVIAGIYRSRILKSLKGLALRPTSDRLRETLFNVLGPAVVGARFVDVFAGTGAVGIEAPRRGADSQEPGFARRALRCDRAWRRRPPRSGDAGGKAEKGRCHI